PGYLDGNRNNGSYVSLRPPSGQTWTTVIETADATAAQTFAGRVAGGLTAGATVHVWRTKLSGGDNLARMPDVTPSGATFAVTLEPGYVSTLTSGFGGGKGTATSPVPHGLALPYADNFDSYPTGRQARYLSDMQGAFEVVGCGGGRGGRCVRQMTPREPILWRPASDNYALVGDTRWANYTVSTDVMLEQSGYAFLVGRASWQWPVGVDAYYLVAGDDGQWSVRRNDVTNPLTTLASGRVAALGTNRWHNLSLTLSATTITARIDGATVATLNDLYWVAGQVGVGTSKGVPAQFDNLS